MKTKKTRNYYPLQSLALQANERRPSGGKKKQKKIIDLCFCMKTKRKEGNLFFRTQIQVVNHICARLFSFLFCMLAFWHTTSKGLFVVEKLNTAKTSSSDESFIFIPFLLAEVFPQTFSKETRHELKRQRRGLLEACTNEFSRCNSVTRLTRLKEDF